MPPEAPSKLINHSKEELLMFVRRQRQKAIQRARKKVKEQIRVLFGDPTPDELAANREFDLEVSSVLKKNRRDLRVLEAAFELGSLSVKAIAAKTGIPERTVSFVLEPLGLAKIGNPSPVNDQRVVDFMKETKEKQPDITKADLRRWVEVKFGLKLDPSSFNRCKAVSSLYRKQKR